MRAQVEPPQSLADAHTLVAQKYSGYFVGHPFRAAQQRTGSDAIVVDASKPWRGPSVVADDCQFCARLSDNDAIRRIAGYQHAIDIEVMRARADSYAEWLATAPDEVPDFEEISVAGVIVRRGVKTSQTNRRRFIETHGERFEVTSIALVDLPLRLKRKICIEWNHIYRDWLREQPEVRYDAERREFYRDVDQADPVPVRRPKEWWSAEGLWRATS